MSVLAWERWLDAVGALGDGSGRDRLLLIHVQDASAEAPALWMTPGGGLHPGESFEYTSGTPLGTPSGIMVGTYEMVTNDGESFDVEIPAFSLDSPYQPVNVH